MKLTLQKNLLWGQILQQNPEHIKKNIFMQNIEFFTFQ